MELSNRSKRLVVDNFHTPDDFLALDFNTISNYNFTNKERERYFFFKEADLSSDLALLDTHMVTLISIWDSNYPKRLSELYDPPLVLYVKGNMLGDDNVFVSIVGSRHANTYGISVADRISGELSRYGVVIVSGGASGIDSVAHNGALKNNGKTIAVLGCGIDVTYPSVNKKLFEKIAETGAVITEYPFTTQPEPWRFPGRNRIVSGLSDAVLVCQAPVASGSLITANYALEQGREVFAVPGNITDNKNAGCNKLIKEGAKLVENAADILDELGLLYEHTISNEEELDLAKAEMEIFKLLSFEPVTVDYIINKTNMTVADVMSNLTLMEMQGYIKRLPGNSYIKSK